MKKIGIIFPKDSEAMFNTKSNRAFGGATVQMYNIMKELSIDENFKVISYIPKYSNIDIAYNNVNLISTFNEKDNIFIKIYGFFSSLLKTQPDVLIQHGLTIYSCILAPLCRLINIKFIFMFASDVEAEGKYQNSIKKCYLFKLLLKYSYLLVTQNTYQYELLKGKHNKDSIVIYNGFNLPELRNINDSLSKRDHVLWVGRFAKVKKPHLLYDIAKENLNTKFVMIAPYTLDFSKDEYESFQEKCKKLGNIEFIEYVKLENIGDYFKNAIIFINTSDYEGFPQTFIQASMYGVPILSLNINPDKILTNHAIGYIYNASVDQLINGLKELLNDKERYIKIGNNAYNYSKKYHNITYNVKLILDKIYK